MPLTIKKIGKLGALASLAVSISANAVDLGEFNGTKVALKGFIKANAMVSNYSDGSLSAQSLGRDFYIPSLTPVGGDSETNQFDMHAKTSRFGLATETTVDGKALKTYVEMDFVASAGGNERISNSYGNRLRHAFLTYGNWLVGQTWSTAMNVGALPESVDFIGNTDAMIFNRQTMIRYTAGNFQIAIENPETTVTPYLGGGRIVTDDNSVPDIVARYNLKAGNANLAFIALARQLAYDNGGAIDDSANGYGISVSGSFKFGSDDLKFVVNTGSGFGRYIGLNIANGAVVDENGELEAIDSTAFSISYRHFWNDKLRSSFIYSTIEIDNDTALTGSSVSKMSERAAVNLMYSPAPKLTFGAEVSRANREIESGVDGSMTRFQVTGKLAF